MMILLLTLAIFMPVVLPRENFEFAVFPTIEPSGFQHAAAPVAYFA
jgi:hypothetical protein